MDIVLHGGGSEERHYSSFVRECQERSRGAAVAAAPERQKDRWAVARREFVPRKGIVLHLPSLSLSLSRVASPLLPHAYAKFVER